MSGVTQAPRGAWVMVCGPSGAGKDSVIGWAQASLRGHDGIVFARRLVTRAAHAGSDHDEISPAGLRALHARAQLAWHWEAHGHGYGIQAAEAVRVAQGQLVVVNGSREHVAGVACRADVRVVLVTAPPRLLQARLDGRGRDSTDEVLRRMHRNQALGDTVGDMAADLTVVNDGSLEAAGARLRDWLLAVKEKP